MSEAVERRAIWEAGRGRAAAGLLAGLLYASAVSAAPLTNASPTSALRRACATGALTPYTCAQHGITTAPVPKPAPKPATAAEAPITPAAAAPPASPTPAAAALPRPADAAPTGVRDRRRRALAAVGPSVRPFQDTKKRYDLEIPDGWELRMQGGFAAFAHGDDWIQLRTTAGATPQAAAAAGVDLLRNQYDGFLTSADADTAVGGRPGRRMVLSARSKAGRPSSIVVVAATMRGGDNLVVIAGGDPADAAVIDGGVSAIVRTLHFR